MILVFWKKDGKFKIIGLKLLYKTSWGFEFFGYIQVQKFGSHSLKRIVIVDDRILVTWRNKCSLLQKGHKATKVIHNGIRKVLYYITSIWGCASPLNDFFIAPEPFEVLR